MIRLLPSHVSQQVNTQPANSRVKSTSATADFQTLMQPAATTAKPQTAAVTTPAELPHLGPFTADPNTHPATAAPTVADPVTSSPYLPAGYAGDTNPMNKDQHVQTMNDWLQNYTKWSNDNKTQIYQQAMINWQQNDQRCQALGIASPPKPAPPTLDPIQPMPASYWFS
jgi:hypothetical protein